MSLIHIRLPEIMECDKISKAELLKHGLPEDVFDDLVDPDVDVISLFGVAQLIDTLWKMTGVRYEIDDLFGVDYFQFLNGGIERDIFIHTDGTWAHTSSDIPWGITRKELDELE